MKTKTIKLLSLAITAASAITNQALAVITPAESTVPSSVTDDSRTEEALADIWSLQDMNGATVGVVNRQATTEDETKNSKILKHPALKGGGLILLATLRSDDGESSRIAWGKVLPQSYWEDLENRLVTKIEIAASKSQTPTHEQAAKGAQEKGISVTHRNPLVTEVDVNSATLENLRNAGCVIFTVFPSKITAVGVITTEGLVLLDDMGGNRGLKYLSLGPLGPGVIVPSDPEKFAVNLGKTAVNPFQQAKVYEKVLKDTVRIVPGGQEVATATKPLRQAVEQLGNIQLAGTTPGRIVDGLQKDPVKTVEKGLETGLFKPAEQVGGAVAGGAQAVGGAVAGGAKAVGGAVAGGAKAIGKKFGF